MGVHVTVPYEKTFSSSKSLEETFGYLSDFSRSIPENFKGVARFEQTGPANFQWEFEKIGHSGYELHIKLNTTSTLKSPKSIELKSISGPGYSQFEGSWQLTSGFDGCQVHFKAAFGLELPIPFLLKSVAVPLAQKEFTKFFDRYIHCVEKNLAE